MDIGGNYKDDMAMWYDRAYNPFMLGFLLLLQNSDTILVEDTIEGKRFATSQVISIHPTFKFSMLFNRSLCISSLRL